jgi:UDP-N-acetylmuramate dehydrogenase
MSFVADFAEIVKAQEPLAAYTFLRLGGPAQYLAQPRSLEELSRLVVRCKQEGTPYRLLGGGSNVLVRDEGVRGVVIRLSEPAFTRITVQGRQVKAAAGATLSALISEAARRSLAGVEALIGIPGTIGGGLRSHVAGRTSTLGEIVRQIEILDGAGEIQLREGDDLDFDATAAAVQSGVILSATLELQEDASDSILKRMRKFWIQRKSHQPLSFEACARIFREPRGMTLLQMMDQAGLKDARVGGAEVSDRDPNYLIARPGATSRDVLRLIEMIRTRVYETTGQKLQLDLDVW